MHKDMYFNDSKNWSVFDWKRKLSQSFFMSMFKSYLLIFYH